MVTDPADPRFGGLDPDLVRAVADAFARNYQPPGEDTDWFGQIRQLAADLGFAPNQKVYKQDPEAYPGSIREASQIIRILLTGTPRSPDLPPWPPRSAPTRCCAGFAPFCNVPGTIRAYCGLS